ncbi:MAG: ribokinase [Spirochaetales bacterium]
MSDRIAGAITVVGSSNVDLVMKLERLPARGESVTDGTFRRLFGGKGANQAVAAARAGAAVHFVSCVGDDAYAAEMIAEFQADGIDASHVRREPGESSGTALIMVGESGDNYIAIAPGANRRLDPRRLDSAHALIAESDLLLLQHEIPTETVLRAIEIAAEEHTPVVFNFAPARDFPVDDLAHVDTLVVNETEAASLTGTNVCGEREARRAAGALRKMGVSVAIVTLGAAGSVVSSDDGVELVPAFQAEAVDTTAAGDTYCGCLAAALAEGRPLRDAVRFASAGAALSVRRIGAQASIPRREEIVLLLDR